ncbi:hypothetical protein NKJ23_29080 [Mesorhizobium sp. M0184]|uniref:hypothetical protein n=1 Tax=Mesorhizobium sp. M0184 TaxID=2956906 RepID=UPI00333D39B4
MIVRIRATRVARGGCDFNLLQRLLKQTQNLAIWRRAPRPAVSDFGVVFEIDVPPVEAGLDSFDPTELTPQHFCARCTFGLRRASKVIVKASARRLEQSIDNSATWRWPSDRRGAWGNPDRG